MFDRFSNQTRAWLLSEFMTCNCWYDLQLCGYIEGGFSVVGPSHIGDAMVHVFIKLRQTNATSVFEDYHGTICKLDFCQNMRPI